MKKISTIFFMVLLVFVLGGCDLIGNETIDQVTEDFCLENPESELCVEDALATIEENVVLSLFNDMLLEYDLMDITEFCVEYISAASVDLLDSCKTDISSLFPKDMENYDVDSVTNEGDEYIIVVSSKTDAEKLQFVLKSSVDNGTPQITGWSYSEVYVLVEGISKDEVVSMIEMFILDMENEMLTDTQVCSLWDGIDDDCDGIEDARMKFKAGADLSKTINILDTDDDDDTILVGEVSFTMDGHVTVLKIAFDIDNTGTELKLMIHDIDSDDDGILDMYLTADESLILFNEFVVDYLDPLMSFDDLNMMYFDNEMTMDFDDQRMMDMSDGLVVNVITTSTPLLSEEGFFVIEVEFVVGSETRLDEVHIKPIRLELSYNINFGDMENDNEDYIDLEEVKDFWNDFVEDYFDSTVTTEEINLMYFNGMLESDFMENRVMDLEDGTMISTTSVNYSNDFPDSFFDIELMITTGDETFDEILTIKVEKSDMTLYMSFENQNQMDYPTYEEALMVLNNYKEQYNHMSMLSTAVCENTVVDYQFEQCIMERDMMISDGYLLVDIELYMMDDYYMADFTYEHLMVHQMTESKIVFFNMNDDGTYLLEFYYDSRDSIDKTEVELLLQNFVKDTGDTSVLTTNVCHFLSDPGEDNDCDGIVSKVRDEAFLLELGYIENMDGEYVVEFIFSNEFETYSEYYIFHFYYDEDMVLKSSIHMLETQMNTYEEIWMLFAEITNCDRPVTEVCSPLVDEESSSRCEAIRDFHESNDYYLTISDLTIDDSMNITVSTITFDFEGQLVELNTFVLYYLENSNGENLLHIDSTEEGNNPLYE